MKHPKSRPCVRPGSKSQGQVNRRPAVVTGSPSASLLAQHAGFVKPPGAAGAKVAPFPHPPRPCPGCTPLPLGDGKRSGVWACGDQVWRKVNPERHLLRTKGRAVCLERQIWDRAKALGARFLVVHAGTETFTVDAQTFDARKFEVRYPGYPAQVGLGRSSFRVHTQGATVGAQLSMTEALA